jgi:asparagine synthase (glutamine-hydrolysing)
MSRRIAHRGPDGAGKFVGGGSGGAARVGLVHRRLAILDPDARSNQPFVDGALAMVFNGEIYNFREVREELSRLRPEWIWRTSGDTEVLLAAYRQWGERAFDRLNGMFAVAIWDAESQTLMVARDRMGQKPLYVASFSGAIAFASELSALRAVPWVDATVDGAAIASYLRWGYVPSPGSVYRGITKLPPGCWMMCRRGGCDEAVRYFDPNDPKQAAAELEAAPSAELANRSRVLVLEAVKRHMVSDVPVGCFLSGGIDSSIVAAGMCRAAARASDVNTFSIGFDDPRYDETAYAAAVARHLGTTHRQFQVSPDAAADLPKLAEVFGEPFGDSSALPTMYLSRQTRGHVKVALGGDGADELFGGYERYRAMSIGQKLSRVPAAGRLAAWAGWKKLPGSHPKSRLFRLKRLLASLSGDASTRYAGYMRLFDDQQIEALMPDSELGEDNIGREFRRLSAGRDDVRAALAVDRVTYLPEDLLTKLDRASMLHALEVRSPFLDGEVVRFAAGLRSDQLIGGGRKRLLREAFGADLPGEVFRRRKMGFAVPIGVWFSGPLRPMLHDLLFSSDSLAGAHFDRRSLEQLTSEHHESRVDHSQRLYALLMLELWHRSR